MNKHLAVVAALAAALAWSTQASAAGSSSGSSSSSRADDYTRAVRAVDNHNYNRARRLLEGVVARSPRNADAWNYLGFSQRKLGHFDESMAAYRRALAIDPDHLGANEYLGELYLDTGKPEQAKAQLNRLRELCGERCEEYRDLERAIRTRSG